MASLQRIHPEWERFVLLVGETAASDLPEASFTTVRLEALPLPGARQFCFRYSILELNTAAKPWMFEHLFARGYDRVVYLDPDIVVYSPLVELDGDAFLTLTPHLTGSIPGDAHPSERAILQAGAYNLGFLAVSRHPALERFLAWWQEKLEFQCVVDIGRGLFVDQKWMDLAPGLFPDVNILRHDGYNVAYWNLRQRSVEGGTLTVNGAPLRFFHFSGVDPSRPRLISRYDTLQLDDASGTAGAGALVSDYIAALRAAEYESLRDAPYAYATFAGGTPVRDRDRIAYRNSPKLQAAGGDDPFAHPELFTRDAVRKATGKRTFAGRLLQRARPLMRYVPQRARDAVRQLVDPSQPRSRILDRRPAHLKPGLNIVGYFAHETGVGESARLCLQSCEAVGLPSHAVDVEAAHGLAKQALNRASIYHVNADAIPAVYNAIPQLFEASSYNIGVWHWELPELPDAWINSAAPLDEIWAPSAFVQSAISRKVTIPVVHMPHGIELTAIEPCSPEELGVPHGRFTFLFMFDLASVVERKNPLAAVEAFRRAFPAGAPVALLIKAGHAERHRHEYAALEERLRGIPNVYLSDRMLSRARVNGLLAACDSVVSLHRSEGFGLILAEAMELGKAVIATGWSGNMDFMNSGNSCPVGYELVTLERSFRVYEAGQQWAEPDVEHAAHLMRRVADDDAWRNAIGERAKQTIRTQFSPTAAGLRYRRRLAFLGLIEE